MGIRVGPKRSWGFVSCSPIVIDFGYLRFNRWWWHNLCATYAWIYLLRHREWPLYHEWDQKRKQREAQMKDDGWSTIYVEPHEFHNGEPPVPGCPTCDKLRWWQSPRRLPRSPWRRP